jgi:hypothetical protein
MSRQSRSMVNEASPRIETYNVNGLDWKEATREMRLINLSAYHVTAQKPTQWQSDDIRPFTSKSIGD